MYPSSTMASKYQGEEASGGAGGALARPIHFCARGSRAPGDPQRVIRPLARRAPSRAQSFFAGKSPLPESIGIVLCLGFGFGFCAITLGLVKLETVFGGTKITSEFFNTAGRDVKVGLTAAVIVSQWTWAATLLQSSNVAWQYGVSGPFW